MISLQTKKARLIENRPMAQHQWSLILQEEDDRAFADFEPGQFCMLSLDRLHDPLLPRAFAIVCREEGRYQFIYKAIGKFTKLLTRIPKGESIQILGPLGNGIEWKNRKTTFVAGGVGYASLIPSIDFLKKQPQPSAMNLFYGVRTDRELIRQISIDHHISSDDGSIGYAGYIPQLLLEKKKEWEDSEQFYICGPNAMMRAVFDILPKERSFYFMEEAMGCGVGICVACVLPLKQINGETKPVRSCLEGPVFRGSQLETWRSLA